NGRQIPGRDVVPHGKQFLDVRGYAELGVDATHAIETTETGVDRIQRFTPQLHVVPPPFVEAQRKVVPELVDVCAVVLGRPDVAANIEPSEHDAGVAVDEASSSLRVIGPVRVIAGELDVAVEHLP